MRRIDFLKTTGSLLALGLLGTACGADDDKSAGGAGGSASGTGGSGTAGTGTAGTGTAGTGTAGTGTAGTGTAGMAGTGGSTGGSTSASCAQVNAQISANHGHMLTVPAADVMAAQNKTYDIKGSSGHPHTVTVTADDFSKLAMGMTVMVTSSVDAGHDHTVTLVCA